MHRKILLLSVAIAVIVGSILAANITFIATAAAAATAGSTTVAASTGRSAGSPYMYSQSREKYTNPSEQAATSLMNGWNQMLTFGKNLFKHGNYRFSHWGPGMSENVTITSEQAKSAVEADIPNLKVGTPTSFRLSWIVPVEDGKGIVTMIRVSHVTANTTDQAKTVVTESLAKGWTTGTPKLVRTVYYVPLLDSSNKTISYIRVNGRSGNIMLASPPTLAVTSAQVKTIVDNATKNFTVDEVKERVGSWIVSIKDGDKTVMTVILGKINTPKSEDAVNAVKSSLEKGWTAGEPKLQRTVYNVPIIDANGTTIGILRVNGRTGDILGFPSMYR